MSEQQVDEQQESTTTLLKKISKTRELTSNGEVCVEIGDEVTATDTVAKVTVPGELHIIRLAEQLEVQVEELSDKINLKLKARVSQGEPLVSYKTFFGLFKNEYRSEVSGRIEFIQKDTAHIGIRTDPVEQEITAYISGKVTEIEYGKSVTIESRARYIQGIFGVGGERTGKLWFIDVPADSVIDKDDIPRDISSQILAGGKSFTAEALELAARRGAIGIITGSIDDSSLTRYLGYPIGIALTGNENVPATLIITEGFGHLSMNRDYLEILRSSHGMIASINGATQVRAGAVRPEIIIPVISSPESVVHGSADQVSREVTDSESKLLGKKVRIIREPYFGIYGEVIEEPAAPAKVETGAMLRVLKIKGEADNKEFIVPRANIEIV